jgi:hypothetical protein
MKKHRPVLYFPFFGNDPRYLRLLRQAWDSYHDTGAHHEMPAVVLLDEYTDWSEKAIHFQGRTIRTEIEPYRGFIREGNDGSAFDHKAALIMSAFEKFNFPWVSVFCDIDNLYRKNIAPTINALPEDFKMALPPIPLTYTTPIVHKRFPEGVEEMTSALMAFPPQAQEAGARYRYFFQTSTERDHKLLEQRTWSLVWHSFTPKVNLGREMSWSRFWGEEPAEAMVRHMHGEEKFDSLAT